MAEPADQSTRPGAVAHHILVVEDDPQEAAALQEKLESRKFKVSLAKDGGQAHATFAMRKPDFVLLDIMLPGETGFEVCEHMKRTESTVPIVMLSAIDMDDARSLALRVGADEYLVKPCDAETLEAVIRRVSEDVWQANRAASERQHRDRVKFSCNCGKKFRVSEAHRGKSMTCPKCGEPLTVPR